MKLAFHDSPSAYLESVRGDAVSGEERRRRQRLGEFLRRVEPSVHGAVGAERERLRGLLGWDDESLHAFVAADVVVHTSPHAAMNAFEPAFAFPWLAARLASLPLGGDRGVHLRTSVTHNNLGDLRWRPYAWWRRSAAGPMVKTQIFSRSAKVRHHVLFSKPPPRLAADSLCALDREATALAAHAGDYAGFCLLYRAAVERHAGLHAECSPVEVPLQLLNAFAIEEDGIGRWRRALAASGMSFRVADDDGRLVEVAPADAAAAVRAGRTLLGPNAVNLVQAQLLGISCMVGAERMAKYVPEMAGLVGRFVRELGLPCRRSELVSLTDVPIAAVLEHDAETRARFAGDGLRGSLPVGAADIGARVGVNLERLLGARLTAMLRPPVALAGARGVA